MDYNFRETEKKWQEYWDTNQTFKTSDVSDKPKAYVLDMFPYPSGSGLHVGHPEGYTATDIYCRFKRMKGFNVLHPMGWDAFGLPAERYAMQTNIHPRETTEKNIDTFRRQIKMLGLSYDWSRELSTTDENYYRWTQWIFLQLYNAWYDPQMKKARPVATLEQLLASSGTIGLTACNEHFSAEAWHKKSRKEKHDFIAGYRLAYISTIPVNWCEALGTVLANEEVQEWTDKGYAVERRPMKQWMMRITAYCERLLEDAEVLDWPVSTLDQQRNWIGRSEGAEVDFLIKNFTEKIKVFTTRPDTLFGATYMVLAPEHPLVMQLTTPEQQKEVEAYKKAVAHKSDIDRGADKEKTGVFTGAYAINPATGKDIPIWIADYVLMGYGTGAIMAVPAHDERDFEFARKYTLPVVKVVHGSATQEKVFPGDGTCINSQNNEVSLNGLSTADAKRKITEWLTQKGYGKGTVQYKLRDWLFSRQRYWGEPVPIIHLEDGTLKALTEEELPLLLPPLEKFQPSGTTESPLALATQWVHVTDPETGMKGKRETNTMPQWAGSCWYYLRYIDPKNEQTLCDPEKEKYWMPVDLYVGGAEHAVLHLMYARFWHKVLYDLGHLSTAEPFQKLRHQGIILGEDSRKMSKSRGNVVNPDDVVNEFGADALRLFEMFMGPLEEMKPWSTHGVKGVFRFLSRVWRLFINDNDTLEESVVEHEASGTFRKLYHQTVKKVGEDIETLRFNTAISQLMVFVNEATKLTQKPRKEMESFVLLLAPFAPHLAEELWSRLGHTQSLAYETFPSYTEEYLSEDRFEYPVSVNGKTRFKINIPLHITNEEIERQVLAADAMQKWLNGHPPKKVIIVPGRIVNIVV